MIVEVLGGAQEIPEVRVVHVDDLTRLHVALGEVTDEEADQVLREAGLGRLDDGTGFVDVDALRAAAEPQSSAPDWARRWDGMLGYARDKGWLSDDGSCIQVHVESAAGG